MTSHPNRALLGSVIAMSLSACAVSGADKALHEGRDSASPGPSDADAQVGWPDGKGDAGYAAQGAFDAGRDAAESMPESDGSAPIDASGETTRDASESTPEASTHPEPDADTQEDAAPVAVVHTLDGTIEDQEWSIASSATHHVATDWGSNQLTYLAADLDDTYLWLAVRGSVENDKNALLIYIDALPNVGIAPTTITDQQNEDELDDALSTGLNTPAGFLADFAWGTLRMSTNVRGSSAQTGFRGLQNPADLAWVDAPEPPATEVAAQTVCTADACEMRLPLTTLGGTGPITLFARLTNSDGEAFANQTLPLDDVSAPTVVHTLLTLER